MLINNQKISDPLLYFMYETIDNLIKHEQTKPNSMAIEENITFLQNNLNDFEKFIEIKRRTEFQFSIEELYFMYGQFDKFISIEFHKFSDSAKKYGRTIQGVITYGKEKRRNLEIAINSGNAERTREKITLSINRSMKNEIIENELLVNGFDCGDIFIILDSNNFNQNSYIKEGIKDIPNTFNLTLPKETDYCLLALSNFQSRLKQGYNLIQEELYHYLGIIYYLNPLSTQLEIFIKNGLNENGEIKDEVIFYYLTWKNDKKETTIEEKTQLNNLLNIRKRKRFIIIDEELKKIEIENSNILFRKYPEIYADIYLSSLTFEETSLIHSDFEVDIYWDFRSYLHIYLRHCSELQIQEVAKNKTPFQYNQKNIQRILIQTIEMKFEEIKNRLSNGKDYRVWGEKSIYFNGNYYAIRIEPNGRVDSFHPYK